MSLSSCPKCWDTPCRCGHGYRSWTLKDIDDQIAMLNMVRMEKSLEDITLPGDPPPPRQPPCPLPDVSEPI